MFCTACGSPVGAGNATQATSGPTCSKCGAAVLPDDVFCTSCGSLVASQPAGETQVLSAGDTMAGDAATAMKTLQLDPVAGSGAMPAQYANPNSTAQMPVAVAQPQAHPAQSVQKQGKPTSFWIAIIVAIVAVLVIAGLVLYIVNPGEVFGSRGSSKTETTSSQTTGTDSGSSSSSNTKENSSSSSSSSSVKNDPNYSDLVDAYKQLSSYDSSLGNLATDFNNNYLSDSLSTRRSGYNNADSLRSKIETSQSRLESMNVKSSSPLYDCYTDMLECYSDCYHRADDIADAWDRSYSSSDPSADQEYILEPIARSKGSDNHSKYKTDFDSRYPNCNPANVK